MQISGDWRKLTEKLDPNSGVMVSIEIFKTDYISREFTIKNCSVLKNIYFCKQIRLHRKKFE